MYKKIIFITFSYKVHNLVKLYDVSNLDINRLNVAQTI